MLDALVEDGYADLSIESVAERAGVHKTTIYRRWHDTPGLVADALLARSEDEVPVPDTGDTTADLAALARSVAANLASPVGRALARTMVGQADTPEIAEITEDFWRTRFGVAREIVDRGVARGDLPADTDGDRIIEMLVAPIWFRTLVRREAPDEAEVEDLVSFVLGEQM